MGIPQVPLVNQQWWPFPFPDPGDPAPYLRIWLRERMSVEDQAVLARAELSFQKANLTAKLEYLNQVENIAGRYMK